MKNIDIQLSKEFKIQAAKAITSLVLFAIVYIALLAFAIGLTMLCVYGGITLIFLYPMFLIIILGIGLILFGVLILVFLIKFIFKSHKIDRTNLIEVKKEDEPQLFALIEEVIQEVGANYPKRVYLSPDVNASVFYDSSFWSMFLPIKKNLSLGVGLVNTITKQELKAILGHEFGHFSQRTMKVGSYVYNVNQIIFNLVNENDSYNNAANRLANSNWIIYLFVIMAVQINLGIQWILKKMYIVVNKTYLALSREMEFQADNVAASITGYEPLKSSLLRHSLAVTSYESVLNFYNDKIAKAIVCDNIFRDQHVVIQVLGELNNFPIKNDLPQVSLEEQSKFDKSKLIIKDQWSSHPTVSERISQLEKTGFTGNDEQDFPAKLVFQDFEKTQELLTSKLFEQVVFSKEPEIFPAEEFQLAFEKEVLANSFPKAYNGYYNDKNPLHFQLEISDVCQENNLEQLFSDEKVEMAYTAFCLTNDIETLKHIANKNIQIKTFDYDGKRYKRRDATQLIDNLTLELNKLNTLILQHDKCIYSYFKKIENQLNGNKLDGLYRDFFMYDNCYEHYFKIHQTLLTELQFIQQPTNYDEIISKFKTIRNLEVDFKSKISSLLSDPAIKSELNQDMKSSFELYLSKNWEYFGVTQYIDDNLSILYSAINYYYFLISRKYFILKKNILDYQLSELHRLKSVDKEK